MTLAYNTQQIKRFMTAVASSFCAITSMRVLASIVSSDLQSSRVYLMSTLDVTHDKMYQTLPLFIAARAWERGYNNAILRLTGMVLFRVGGCSAGMPGYAIFPVAEWLLVRC